MADWRSALPRTPFISSPNITFSSAVSHGSKPGMLEHDAAVIAAALDLAPIDEDAARVGLLEPHGNA